LKNTLRLRLYTLSAARHCMVDACSFDNVIEPGRLECHLWDTKSLCVQCYVLYIVNVWWLYKRSWRRSNAATQLTTHPNYTSSRCCCHGNVHRQPSNYARPCGFQMPNTHEAVELSTLAFCLHGAALSSPLSQTYPAPGCCDVTYAPRSNDLIRLENAITLKLLCKYFTGC